MDSEGRGGIVFTACRGGNLLGFDEAHVGHAIGVDEESQEGFAVAVAASDDFLLALVPAIDVDEFVDQGLDKGQEFVRGASVVFRHGLVGVAGAHEVGDSVFMSRYKTYMLSLPAPKCSDWARGNGLSRHLRGFRGRSHRV